MYFVQLVTFSIHEQSVTQNYCPIAYVNRLGWYVDMHIQQRNAYLLLHAPVPTLRAAWPSFVSLMANIYLAGVYLVLKAVVFPLLLHC